MKIIIRIVKYYKMLSTKKACIVNVKHFCFCLVEFAEYLHPHHNLMMIIKRNIIRNEAFC